MKYYLLTSVFLTIHLLSFGQLRWDNSILDFDSKEDREYVVFESDSNNIWEVGRPQKPLLDSAYSGNSVIITDSVNSYPTNDTSSFTVYLLADGEGFDREHTVLISGQYYVNSDSLTDYGLIEFSPDSGSTWINLLNDTVYNIEFSHWEIDGSWWYGHKPVLTGNSNGWRNFNINIANVGQHFTVEHGDTIAYRFTFISDSIQTNKDGLMFDDLRFEDWASSIEEYPQVGIIMVFPNPASQRLHLSRIKTNKKEHLQIINYFGQLVYENHSKKLESIDISHLDNGIYFLRYSNSEQFSNQKFVVHH